eukprot:s5218_g1.t1
MFAKIRPKHLGALVRLFPFDRSGTRVFSMAYVFDKQLYRAQQSRRLKRQADILEAAEDCPDPWESCYIPPPDEPVTGMKEVPGDILEWGYAAALEAASRRAKEQAERRRDPAPHSGVSHLDLMEMLGYVDELTCPTEPEGEGMVTILPETIPCDNLPEPRLSDEVLRRMTGLVRGAKQQLESRVSNWARIQELIDVLWKTRRVNVASSQSSPTITRDDLTLLATQVTRAGNTSKQMSGRLGSVRVMVTTARFKTSSRMQTSQRAGTRMMKGRKSGIQPPIKVGRLSLRDHIRRQALLESRKREANAVDAKEEADFEADDEFPEEALDKAKQQLKLAAKKGYGTILERFDNDVEYTMHSVSGGYDREFLAIEDILTQSALPNQGRSKEQRYLGVGTYGGGSQQQNTRNEAIARVLYMHECNAAALRAGLISFVSHDPFCIMWLGGYTAEDSARSSGDLSYADTDATRWDSFQRLFDESGCADIPWVVLPGNHEIEPDEITGEPFLPFRSRWRTPQSKEAAVSAPPEDAWQGWLTYDFPSMGFDFGSSFFSLEVGCVHLLVLNPYTDASPSSPQITWLQSELKRINRSKTEHVVVLTHAPWQHSSRAHRPEMEAATRNLLSAAGPLLLPDKIDLVFSGHVHAFERSLPIDGVQHFVVGHGGNMEGLYDNWLPSSTSAFHAGDHYGWGLLHLRPRRLGPSTFNARRGADGAVMDAVEFWPRDLTPSHPSRENPGAGAPEPGLLGATFAACLVVCLCACFYRRARVRARYEEETSLRREAATIGAEEGEAAVVTGDSEAEAIFREAYEAEAERAKLLSKQVEAALAEQLGAPEGIKINVEAPAAPAPGEPGGSTWRFAYEAVKKRTASLEGQLEKARRIAAPAATPPADPTAAAVAEAEANFVAPDVSTQNLESGNAQPNFQQQGNMMDPMQQMQKLREVGSLAEDEESVLRLLTLGTLPNQENAFSLDPTATKKELPPLNRAREALSSEDFVANDAIVFERSYIFPGVIPDGRDPAVALESLQTRMAGIQAPGATETELFLQPQKEEGKSLLIMVHKGDLPDGEIESWQWVIWVLSVGATFVSSLSTTLAVVAVGPGLAAGSDVGDLTAAFEKLVPVAGAVLATVAAQETARRTVASNYKVELTPPYLLPTLLSGSIGCLGTLTRRLSTAPNREAEVNMSLAAPIAGLIVSLGFMAAGLAMGPGTDRHTTTQT